MFVAVVPPLEAVEDLAAFLAPRQEAGADLRWTDEDQWHVTVAFMAQVPERAVDDVLEGVVGAVASRTPLPLRCQGAGTFPHPGAARVLWAGLAGDLDGLSALARGVRRACNATGGSPEGGPFHPHVTLARARRPIEATRWLRVLEGYAGPAWTATEVTVLASHLGEGRGRRPRHEVLATAELQGSPAAPS
jgi:RNA 2',3'-cyclic 3'-phosphodiesterase